jgi:hypothetical protein
VCQTWQSGTLSVIESCHIKWRENQKPDIDIPHTAFKRLTGSEKREDESEYFELLFPIVEPAVEDEIPLPETHATQDDAATDSEIRAAASEERSLNQQQEETAHDSEAEEEGVHEHKPEEQGMGGGRWPTRDRRPPERLICYTHELNDKPKSIKEAMKRPDWPLVRRSHLQRDVLNGK